MVQVARQSKGRRLSRRRKNATRQRPMLWLAVTLCLPAAAWLIWQGAQRIAIGNSRQPLKLTMGEARAINADIPIVRGPLKPAAPYNFHGSTKRRRDAVDCLATAAIYETGSSVDGQRAVIQVILNRVRSHGFPATICGVVYQGAHRRTGCQFSFACDLSLDRRRETSGWGAARRRAARALQGYVYTAVGTATHYHTDWVVPYWSASLDKIAKVESHIFYRRPRPAPG